MFKKWVMQTLQLTSYADWMREINELSKLYKFGRQVGTSLLAALDGSMDLEQAYVVVHANGSVATVGRFPSNDSRVLAWLKLSTIPHTTTYISQYKNDSLSDAGFQWHHNEFVQLLALDLLRQIYGEGYLDGVKADYPPL